MTEQFTIEAVLDQCLDEIRAGQATISDCIAKHPTMAPELEALLQMALAIERIPDITPSDEFRRATRERILHLSERADGPTDSSTDVDPEPKPQTVRRRKKRRA